MADNKILVIGGGGREHAICWKLSQSPKVEKIFITPGNCGIAQVPKVSLIKLNAKDNEEVANFAKKECINLVVVGPEEYLANGIADVLLKNGIDCFGPGKDGARLEADKDYAKSFMDRHDIPTAKWKSFTSTIDAKKYVNEADHKALVVKATGLAAGKGVVVASNNEEACQAIDEMLNDKKFGTAGETIVIEELLDGEEVSLLIFTDGKTYELMPPTQDHKRIFDNDEGPNTGGMGAYGPCDLITSQDFDIIKKDIIEKSICGIQKDNIPFIGVLYVGLMLTKNGPKVLEYNCRFGDPETQIIMTLLSSDLYDIMKNCCQGKLSMTKINWYNDRYSCGVILASRGYPQTSSKGQIITGIDDVLSASNNNFIFHSGTSLSSNNELLTNGGRVLMTVSQASTLQLASANATISAKKIKFDGKQYRNDIGHKGIASSILKTGLLSYKSSGVDIDTGDLFVNKIKPMVATTKIPGVMGSIGGFGGLFDTKTAGFNDPILVSGTDGVGTKLKIAIEYGKHDSVGIDLVAMCVNDVLAHGAKPLFFLDYFACGYLNVDIAASVVSGIVEGCKNAGCSLVGGETAEMPDMYAKGEYDLAGFAVGAVERNSLLPKINDIIPGDIVIGLPSSGIHSNGFSLVRKILKISGKTFNDQAPFSLNKSTIGDELLVPTKIYTKNVVPALNTNNVKAFAHITGGGLTENIPRILPDGTGVKLNAENWNILPVFSWLAAIGSVNEKEMLRTFNCGIGGILICSKIHKNQIIDILKDEKPIVIGTVVEFNNKINNNTERVIVDNFSKCMNQQMRKYIPKIIDNLSIIKKKVGVLISGSGTNLQALIDSCKNPIEHMGAEIVLVISNKLGVEGLKRAENAGIKTKVIEHKDYPSREIFDMEMDKELTLAGVEIICLAGFMRILSDKFVKKWKGSMINVHPSLLPSFKGSNAHRDVLLSGVRITGCTVHFVDTEIDSGAIIEQEPVKVLPNDTIGSLQERVKIAEHVAFPRALKLLATGQIKLKDDNTIQWNY
ncbi:hypothetical protein HCN44_004611 [Aphidius gifuensis]|uniref:Trifunctional purine biosynthetic protein adenosine-3 n=1 Tax=Aphidius gifuensis TaxID=684658 RepID=A0A834Y121_APHGI|nr:trifunctional purine biosynthetic protein adenosine-3 [Aphidius gifuensis]KAF7995139.1 hypothetical protein HCN44_004611 [Aphidius gifuensis]